MSSTNEEIAWDIWVPDGIYLVLGASNKSEKSLHEDLVEKDGIKVFKRPSGGESVVLSPKTLIISIRLFSNKLENPQVYFKKINSLILKSMESLGVRDLKYRGISDLAIGDFKILGSSIYRKKKLVFYHAVLNVSEDISLIAKYLKHPTKEPDYRAGRDHASFVTSLYKAGYPISVDRLRSKISESFVELSQPG